MKYSLLISIGAVIISIAAVIFGILVIKNPSHRSKLEDKLQTMVESSKNITASVGSNTCLKDSKNQAKADLITQVKTFITNVNSALASKQITQQQAKPILDQASKFQDQLTNLKLCSSYCKQGSTYDESKNQCIQNVLDSLQDELKKIATSVDSFIKSDVESSLPPYVPHGSSPTPSPSPAPSPSPVTLPQCSVLDQEKQDKICKQNPAPGSSQQNIYCVTQGPKAGQCHGSTLIGDNVCCKAT